MDLETISVASSEPEVQKETPAKPAKPAKPANGAADPMLAKLQASAAEQVVDHCALKLQKTREGRGRSRGRGRGRGKDRGESRKGDKEEKAAKGKRNGKSEDKSVEEKAAKGDKEEKAAKGKRNVKKQKVQTKGSCQDNDQDKDKKNKKSVEGGKSARLKQVYRKPAACVAKFAENNADAGKFASKADQQIFKTYHAGSGDGPMPDKGSVALRSWTERDQKRCKSSTKVLSERQW